MEVIVPLGTQELTSPEPKLSPVPPNLIPTDSRSINHEWAEKTYQYSYLFGRNSTLSNRDEDDQKIQAWIDYGLHLQNELRELGVRKAHEKIITMFRDYLVYMPGSTQLPTNIDDVLVIINDKEWYTTQQDTKQKLIHMITYGIFRKGNNNWAFKASKEWLFKYHIRIDEKELYTSSRTSTRQKKGFVYTNLVQRASNSIADRVQKNMISSHGHYIAVRKKTSCENNSKYRYEKKNFNHFEAYIVYPSDTLLKIMSP